MIEVAWGQAGEFFAQFDGDVIGHVGKRIRIGQLAHLVSNRQRHFLTAQSDVRAPHATDRIQEAVALSVVNIGALTRHDVQGTLFAVLIEHVIAVHVMGFVGFDQTGFIGRGQYVLSRSSHTKTSNQRVE
ncbi:hypothetical protein D3C87_1653520 [compost metagenome]